MMVQVCTYRNIVEDTESIPKCSGIKGLPQLVCMLAKAWNTSGIPAPATWIGLNALHDN